MLSFQDLVRSVHQQAAIVKEQSKMIREQSNTIIEQSETMKEQSIAIDKLEIRNAEQSALNEVSFLYHT